MAVWPKRTPQISRSAADARCAHPPQPGSRMQNDAPFAMVKRRARPTENPLADEIAGPARRQMLPISPNRYSTQASSPIDFSVGPRYPPPPPRTTGPTTNRQRMGPQVCFGRDLLRSILRIATFSPTSRQAWMYSAPSRERPGGVVPEHGTAGSRLPPARSRAGWGSSNAARRCSSHPTRKNSALACPQPETQDRELHPSCRRKREEALFASDHHGTANEKPNRTPRLSIGQAHPEIPRASFPPGTRPAARSRLLLRWRNFQYRTTMDNDGDRRSRYERAGLVSTIAPGGRRQAGGRPAFLAVLQFRSSSVDLKVRLRSAL